MVFVALFFNLISKVNLILLMDFRHFVINKLSSIGYTLGKGGNSMTLVFTGSIGLEEGVPLQGKRGWLLAPVWCLPYHAC